MSKKKVIGLKTGYRGGGATGAGDQWTWGKKVALSDWHSDQDRNGGLFVSYYEAEPDKTNMGDFWYHMVYPALPEDNIPVYWKIKHPVSDEPKHVHHFEKGGSKYFEIGKDRSGWMYQTKSISSWDDVSSQKDKILYFEINGHRDDLYSFCWTSFCDSYTSSQYIGNDVNDDRKKSSWFSTIACTSESSSTNLANQTNISNTRKVRSSRLRNVVGFTVNCMFNGWSYKGSTSGHAIIVPLTICLIMQKPGSSKNYLMMPRGKNSSSIEINQRIDTEEYWGKGNKDKWTAGVLREGKGELKTISYYANQAQIDAIVKDKLEFVGVWWKLGREGQGGGGTHSKGAIAFWNFRPFVVGPDGSLVDTWNTKTYNILGNPRDDYSRDRSLALTNT